MAMALRCGHDSAVLLQCGVPLLCSGATCDTQVGFRDCGNAGTGIAWSFQCVCDSSRRARRVGGTATTAVSASVLAVLAGEKQAAAGSKLSGHLASKYSQAELRAMLGRANGELTTKKSTNAQLLETAQKSIATLQSKHTAAVDQHRVASATHQGKQATLTAHRTASAQANATALRKQAEQAAAAAGTTPAATAASAVPAAPAVPSGSSVDNTTKALVIVTFIFVLVLTGVVVVVAAKTLGGKDRPPRGRSMKITPFETPTAMLPETRPARGHVTAVMDENTLLSQKANNMVADEKSKAKRTTAAKIEQRRVQNHTAL